MVVERKPFNVFYAHKVTYAVLKRNPLLVRDFSKAKIGDFSAIRKYAVQISSLIKNSINLKDYFVIICNPSTSKTNTSFFVAKESARILKKKFSKLIHLSPWKTGKYYLHMSKKEKEKVLLSSAYYTGPSLKGKKVIIVDDCIATGASLKNCIKVLLKQGASGVTCFTYLSMASPKFEDIMSQERVFVEGKSYLKKILSNKKNPIVARCLSILFNMPANDVVDIVDSLKGARKREVISRLTEYASLRTPLLPKLKEIKLLLG